MKQKFKVGRMLKAKITDHMDFTGEKFITKGKNYKIVDNCEDSFIIIDDMGDNNHFSYSDFDKYFSFTTPTLTIKKLTRKRGEKEYHTWQFKVKGKVSNHNFNSPQSRDKSLTMFIKYIQDGDFKIVKG